VAVRGLLQARCSAFSGACSGEQGHATCGIEVCCRLSRVCRDCPFCLARSRYLRRPLCSSLQAPTNMDTQCANLSGAWSVRRLQGLLECSMRIRCPICIKGMCCHASHVQAIAGRGCRGRCSPICGIAFMLNAILANAFAAGLQSHVWRVCASELCLKWCLLAHCLLQTICPGRLPIRLPSPPVCARSPMPSSLPLSIYSKAPCSM
jgi:hypothetical protein